MKLPEDGSVDNMQLNEFNEINKEKLKEIEQFLQILDDWVDEKLTFSEKQVKPRPNMVGITNFRTSEVQGELVPESPFRRKKTLGGLGLNIEKVDVNESPSKDSSQFKKFEDRLAEVMANFDGKKKYFAELQTMSRENLLELHKSG